MTGRAMVQLAERPTHGVPLAESTACPICTADTVFAFSAEEVCRLGIDFWRIGKGGRSFLYRRCDDCELIFCNPLPTENELEAVYASRYPYHLFRARRGLQAMQGVRRFRRARRLLRSNGTKGTRLLDIGCGEGHFLRAARAAGWEVHGMDLPASDALSALHRGGIAARAGRFERVDYDDESFDCITMWHCLEHLRDPRAALEKAARLLRVDGRLLVAVPNLNAAGFKRRRLYWTWMQEPFVHLWHFTLRSLERLLPRSLEVVYAGSYDTYNAQLCFATLPYRGLNRLGRWALSRTGAARSGASESVSPLVWYSTSLQMLGYVGYVALRRAFFRRYEDRMSGSELMLVARRKP